MTELTKLGGDDGGIFWPDGIERPRNTNYTDEDRYRAALYWLTLGSLSKAAEQLGNDLGKEVSRRVLSDWYRSNWWNPLCDYVLSHEEIKIRAHFRKSVDNVFTALEDRIKYGDHVYNSKTGEVVRLPVKAKDLAYIGAIAYDKLRISEGRPTAIKQESTDKRLESALKQFEDIAKQAKLKDVVSEQ